MTDIDAISEVDDYLYLGGIEGLERPEKLVALGITHVLSVLDDETAADFRKWDALPRRVLLLEDNYDDRFQSVVEEADDYISGVRESGGRVYVHCGAGISRSPSVVAHHLAKRDGLHWMVAVNHVKGKREIAFPGVWFMSALQRIFDR